MAAQPQAKQALVTVLDASGNVNSDPVRLDNGDKIYWTSTRGIGDCQIVFPSNHNPLGGQPSVLPLPDGGTIGPFVIRGNKHTEYKYSVIGQDGENDPTIIVDN